MSQIRTINRSKEQYQEQLKGYIKQFVDAIAAGYKEQDLEDAYGQLDRAWRRTAYLVNAGNKGFTLNPDAFENSINKLVDKSKQQAIDKAQEAVHREETKNAERDFARALITPTLIAVGGVLLFLIFMNM